jgi:hypothetical protein
LNLENIGMRRNAERRRFERRINEMAALQMRQEALVREMVRLELKEIYAYNPTPTELILREGIMDFLKKTASKAADFGRTVADDFKKGWSSFKEAVVPMLKEIGEETTRKVVDFISKAGAWLKNIKEKIAAYGKEKVRRFLAPFHEHHDDLAEEGKAIAEESKTNGCVEETLRDAAEKAEDLDSETRPRVQIQMKEARLVAERIRRVSVSTKRLTESRRLLRESLDPFNAFLLAFGGVMLLFKGLAAVFKWMGGNCAGWATKAGEWCQKAYDTMHSFEEAALDTIIPDALAVGFYDFYIFCGLPPVEGDPGRRRTNRSGTEDFGDESAAYEKGKLVGRLGARRDVEVEELENNDPFRRAVKTRMFQTMLFYMLGSAMLEIASKGLMSIYGLKTLVKSGELGAAAAPELSAAVRAARTAAV